MCKVTCGLIVGVGVGVVIASDLYKGGPINISFFDIFCTLLHRYLDPLDLYITSQSPYSCTLMLQPPLGWHEQGSSANICGKKLSEFPSLPVCTVPSSLTSTDAPGHSHIVAVITLQPFVVVARPHGAAVLVQLRSAHLAAPTSIWHCANTWRANQRLFGALTHCRAASSHLKGAEREIVF